MADAQNGHRRAWAEAAHHEVGAGVQDIPVSFARPDHRPSELSMVRRHHLYPDRARLPLSGGDHGLGEPCGAGVAAVQHHGQRIRRRGA